MDFCVEAAMPNERHRSLLGGVVFSHHPGVVSLQTSDSPLPPMVRRPLPPAGSAAAAAGMDADSHSSNGREGATPPLAAPHPHPLFRLHGMAGMKFPAFPCPSKTTPRFVLLNPPWFAVIVLSILTVLLFLTTSFASPNP